MHLTDTTKHFALANQILRSGTSIGANTQEAIGGSSKRDFKAKLDLSYKEARETRYWLCLLRDTKILEIKLAESLLSDCEEIIKILGAILSTLRKQTRTIKPKIENS